VRQRKKYPVNIRRFSFPFRLCIIPQKSQVPKDDLQEGAAPIWPPAIPPRPPPGYMPEGVPGYEMVKESGECSTPTQPTPLLPVPFAAVSHHLWSDTLFNVVHSPTHRKCHGMP
jgi:hypothetical protein